MLVFFNACMIGMNSVLFCLFFIGLASKFIKSGSATLSWFIELSYPIYIIHIIPVTMMSAVFYHLGLSQFSMLSLAVISGFFICVILYYVFIKFTPLNWLINGYSKSPLKIKFLLILIVFTALSNSHIATSFTPSFQIIVPSPCLLLFFNSPV